VPLVDEALQARVVVESERPGRYRFAHPLLGETVLKGISATRKAHLHGELGSALEARLEGRAEQQATRLASHFGEAAVVEEQLRAKALHYLEAAARTAESSFAWAQATASYARWLELAEDPLPEDRASILEAKASAARFASQNPTEAWQGFLEAVEEYQTADDPVGVARSALKAIALPVPMEWRRDLAVQAWHSIRNVDVVLEGQLIASRIRLQGLDTAEVSALARRLEELRGMVDAPVLEAEAESLRVDAAIRIRDLRTAAARARTAAERYEALGDVRAAAAATHSGYLALSLLGEVDAGREALERLRTMARASGNLAMGGYALMGLAGIHRTRADWTAFRQAATEIPPSNFTGQLYAAEEQELRGDGERACALLPPARLAGAVEAFQLIMYGARARILFNAGRAAEAASEFDQWRGVFDAVLAHDASSVPKTLETVAFPFPLESAIALVDDCLVALASDELALTALAVLNATPDIRAAAEFRGVDSLRGRPRAVYTGPRSPLSTTLRGSPGPSANAVRSRQAAASLAWLRSLRIRVTMSLRRNISRRRVRCSLAMTSSSTPTKSLIGRSPRGLKASIHRRTSRACPTGIVQEPSIHSLPLDVTHAAGMLQEDRAPTATVVDLIQPGAQGATGDVRTRLGCTRATLDGMEQRLLGELSGRQSRSGWR
jgi:hypothetical protein